MTDAEAAATIRAEQRQLTQHPRFKGKMFGPDSALELLVQLEKFTRDKEIKFPARVETGEADD